MKHVMNIFDNDNRGSMLVELLLSVALIAIALPFVFQYQHRAIERAQNISVARQMETVQAALERYIVDNRPALTRTLGRNIVRVEIDDLAPYGLSTDIIDEAGDKYQLRVLKSPGANEKTILQGVVVLSDGDISPLRTRQIIELSDNRMGIIDGTAAYGAFGAWRASPADLGVNIDSGLVGATNVNRDNSLYLWRVPSDDAADATMLSPLSLGGHNILNAAFFDVRSVNVDEVSVFGLTSTRNAIFENRTTIDGEMVAGSATVSGIMTSDGKSIEVSDTFKLADTGKFSSFTVEDLWTSNLTLSGVSMYDDGRASILRVNNALDMTGGRIDAMAVTVSFTGSVTPRLVVRSGVYDSINPNFYWDAENNIAAFHDVSFPELNTLATYAVKSSHKNTQSYQIFAPVAANKNATAADFMNAIDQIQKKVRAKYHRLNLQ